MPLSCNLCTHFQKRQRRCMKDLSLPSVVQGFSLQSLVSFCDELLLQEEEQQDQDKKGGW